MRYRSKLVALGMFLATAVAVFAGNPRSAQAWSDEFCMKNRGICVNNCPKRWYHPWYRGCRSVCYAQFLVCRANPGADPW